MRETDSLREIVCAYVHAHFYACAVFSLLADLELIFSDVCLFAFHEQYAFDIV